MELRKSETLGILYDHDCGVWNVNSDFYNYRCDQNIYKSRVKSFHYAVLFSLLHFTVDQSYAFSLKYFFYSGIYSLVVFAGLAQRAHEGLLGPVARDLDEVGHGGAAATRRRRLVLTDTHDESVLLHSP